MRDKWDEDDWDRVRDLEVEDKPYIKEVILPTHLYRFTLERGHETYKEVGFYLMGYFKKGVCYVHDLVEFEYSEQSGGFIESGMARYLRLKVGLPLGLRIVGHMHKHPGFTQYSATDKQNFLRYGNANPLNAFLIYIVEPYEKISGYTATSKKIYSVEVTVRDLKPEEMLLEKDLKIEFTTKVMLPKNSSQSDFNLIFTDGIGSESLKFLSRSTIKIDNKPFDKNAAISENSDIQIIPRKTVEIEDIGRSGIRYRIFMKEEETIKDLEKILKRLTHIPHRKGYNIIFYEEGHRLQRDTIMKNIEHPLVWALEKSVFLPLFEKFYNFWKGFFKILKRKIEDQLKETKGDLEDEECKPISTKTTEELALQTIFHNFSEFWNQVIEILKKRETEQVQELEEIEIAESDSSKKRREFKKYELDYFI